VLFRSLQKLGVVEAEEFGNELEPSILNRNDIKTGVLKAASALEEAIL